MSGPGCSLSQRTELWDQLYPPHRFLSMLEEEIYGANSPIWESGFTMPPSEGTQLVPRPGTRCTQQAVCLAVMAELSAPGGGGAMTGSSGAVQEGSTGVGEPGSLCRTHPTFDLHSIVSSFTLSYGQRCSCSQRPHLQPHHGWEQQQLLEPGFRRC